MPLEGLCFTHLGHNLPLLLLGQKVAQIMNSSNYPQHFIVAVCSPDKEEAKWSRQREEIQIKHAER